MDKKSWKDKKNGLKSLSFQNQRTPFPPEQTNSRKRSHVRPHGEKLERIEYRETTMGTIRIKRWLSRKQNEEEKEKKRVRCRLRLCYAD